MGCPLGTSLTLNLSTTLAGVSYTSQTYLDIYWNYNKITNEYSTVTTYELGLPTMTIQIEYPPVESTLTDPSKYLCKFVYRKEGYFSKSYVGAIKCGIVKNIKMKLISKYIRIGVKCNVSDANIKIYSDNIPVIDQTCSGCNPTTPYYITFLPPPVNGVEKSKHRIKVTLSKTGYISKAGTVTAVCGAADKIIAKRLVPVPVNTYATINITSNVAGAEIWINGELKGYTDNSNKATIQYPCS